MDPDSTRKPAAVDEQEVAIACGPTVLQGTLRVPREARGMVLFAHGTGSGRFSPRNQYVAAQLNGAGLGTLLFDLLTRHEQEFDDRTGRLRFDIPLLSRRLCGAVDWIGTHALARGLPVGLFGASTGAGAALQTAAERPQQIAAVVSRGGRPDLARPCLELVRAPTLLIVGGLDEAVLSLNRLSASELGCEHRLEIVHGASHLFEEPGTLEMVAQLACNWFGKHLKAGGRGTETAALA